MSISGLGVLLLIAFVLIGIRVVLFKLFKPHTDLPSFPVESLTSQSDAETVSQTSSWPVVVLLCVVVVAIVSLMMFGRLLGGG